MLKDCIHQSYLTVLPGVTPELMDLQSALENWRGMNQVTQRNLAASVSSVGGQGKKFKDRCGCSGKCITKICVCVLAKRICSSACHKGKHNPNCKNCDPNRWEPKFLPKE